MALELFEQFFDDDTSTYTYVIASQGEAAIIDPVKDHVDSYLDYLNDHALRLLYSLETHVHADHITGASLLRKKTKCKLVMGKYEKVQGVDQFLEDEEEIRLGGLGLKAIRTPGHTQSCTCYVIDGNVFTGDTLFIGSCGRTDFQEGSSQDLFFSVREKLFKLPPDTKVFPGHDYNQNKSSTIEDEMKNNKRLNLSISEAQFVDIMANLKLAPPKNIGVALPANLKCGD